ncbi:MAG: flagellar biosynthesis protein FlhB [Gammaproteobacteria bacterium]|nr:flagellar biosynthesis protein FlhB [Gammaproteobacteria bacterium]
MAESGSGQEKTEEPTARKLDESKREGQIARSRELNSVMMLLFAGVGLMFFGGQIVEGLLSIMKSSFDLNRSLIFEEKNLAKKFWETIISSLNFIVPFLFLMVVAAVVSPLSMSGWNFSTKALLPKFNRMDPIKGITKIFGWKGLIELLKSLAKLIIVASVGYVLFEIKLPEFLILGEGDIGVSLAYLGEELIWVFILLSSALVFVALVDVPFQLWDHKRQQKMTLQEVKDELKSTEGNPELKGKQRGLQREISQRRMMEEIPEADVVVTNPTHFAVALKYEQNAAAAPVVVAIGADLLALQIRRVAESNDVVVLEAPVLARALYYNSKLGEEIPAGLYLAVAQVLAYIYQLRQYKAYGGVEPQPTMDFTVPDDLRRD